MVETPSPELVDGYLTEIAKAYGVKYSTNADSPDKETDGDDSDGGGAKVRQLP